MKSTGLVLGNHRRAWLASLFFLLLLSFIGAAPGRAQDPTPVNITDDQVNAIAKQMYCPVCENTPLDVCPTQACAQWRDLIREKLAAGWSEKQIKDYFVAQYGERVLAAPPARGFNWFVYVVPPVIIIAGLVILYRTLRTKRQPATAAEVQPAPDAAADEYIQRMEEELRKQN